MASSLRELLVELIGAEVQEHVVKMGARSQRLRFRQFDDATGQRIFAVRDGEDAGERGRRIVREVIAESLCGNGATPIGTADDVAKLPTAVMNVLYVAAATTNNITLPNDDADSEAGTGGDNADPADEAASPNA